MKALTPGPRLMTASLIRRNRAAVNRGGLIRRPWRVAVCCAATLLTLVIVLQPQWADALSWLHRHLLLASVTVACTTAVAVARHRATTRVELKKSWLSALPVPRSVARREALQLELFPALAGAVAVSAIMVLTDIGFVARSGRFADGLVMCWCGLMGAFIAGAIASYAIREPTPVEAPPGSRYVPKASRSAGEPCDPR
jgi:hypothetical protein